MLDERVASRVEIEESGAGSSGGAFHWKEVDRRLRGIAKRRAALDVEEAHWLLVARRMQIHVELGYGSFVEYLERVLDYAPRTAQERLRVAEALEVLPATRTALAAGQVSFSAVRAITRIAKPHNETRWIDASRGKTIRELEILFAGRKPGDDPDDRQDPVLEPRPLRLDLDPDAYALFLEARRHLQDETGEQISDSEVMRTLCRSLLEPGSEKPSARAPYQVALTTCQSCQRAWQDGAGRAIEVPPALIEEAACDCDMIGRIDADEPARVVPSIPPRIRRTVDRRDHGRCVVPGCRAARHLHMHHITPRSRGGANKPHNLILLCGAHHRAFHEGRLVILGTTAGSLRFRHTDGRVYGEPPDEVSPGSVHVDAATSPYLWK